MSPRLYLLVIAFAGLALLLSIVAITLLALNQITVPDVLVGVPGMALTGLLGLLANPRSEGVNDEA